MRRRWSRRPTGVTSTGGRPSCATTRSLCGCRSGTTRQCRRPPLTAPRRCGCAPPCAAPSGSRRPGSGWKAGRTSPASTSPTTPPPCSCGCRTAPGHVVPLEVVAAQDPEIDPDQQAPVERLPPLGVPCLGGFRAVAGRRHPQRLRALGDGPHRQGGAQWPGDRCTHARFGRRGAYPYVPLRHPRPAHRLGDPHLRGAGPGPAAHGRERLGRGRCRARARARPVRYRHPSMSLRAGDYSVMVEGKASGNGAVFVINPDRFPPMPKGEESVAWIVRLRPESGVKAELDWPDSADPQPVWVAGLRLARTVAGNFGVSQWTSMLTVDEADFGADVLELAGTAHLVADGARDPARRPPRRGQRTGTRRRGTLDGRRSAGAGQVGRSHAAPADGRYQLKVTAADGSAPALVPEGVRELLPLIRSHVSGMYARLETGPRASINLVVEAPLAPGGARGTQPGAAAAGAHQPGAVGTPNTVLLRTYYGESCTDTALAVHHELRRRGGYELYWAVQDHSVVVPEGGIRSCRTPRSGTCSRARRRTPRQHARAGLPPQASRAGHHQTFHGYPFKAAGPAQLGSSRVRRRRQVYLRPPRRGVGATSCRRRRTRRRCCGGTSRPRGRTARDRLPPQRRALSPRRTPTPPRRGRDPRAAARPAAGAPLRPDAP